MYEEQEMSTRLSAVVDLVRLGDDATSRGETNEANRVYQLAVSLLATGECAANLPAESLGVADGGTVTFVMGKRRPVQ